MTNPAVSDSATIRSSTRDALRQAANDRRNIIPVLGAGTSVPLGAPNWTALVNRLTASAGLTVRATNATDALLELRHTMGDASFESAIQHELAVATNVTSVTLQILAHSNLQHIVTTNLDHAIENAFHLARRPLHPSNVLCGVGEDLSLFGRNTTGAPPPGGGARGERG